VKQDLYSSKEFEQLVICKDEVSGLRAIICIHNTLLGPAVGGTRIYPYRTMDDAIEDVTCLARAMTYKTAMAGLSFGGGKAVIMADPATEKTTELLLSYGRFIDTLGGRFITGEDVGANEDDMLVIRRETPYVVGLPESHGGGGNTSPPTAYGVLCGIKAAVSHRLRSESLRGLRVSIQGAGNVGSNLARYLAKEGVALWVTDVDIDRAHRVAAETGATVVSPEEVYDLEVEVFSPCGLGKVITDETIPRLRCQVVAGAANNQLADEERHGRMLKEKGITYVVDYVINAGGVINGTDEAMGYSRPRAYRQVERIHDNVKALLETADAEGITTVEAAYRIAEDRLKAVRRVSPITVGDRAPFKVFPGAR